MNDETTSTADDEGRRGRRHGSRRIRLGIAAALLLGLGGVGGALLATAGGAFAHGAWAMTHGGHHGPMTPERARERLQSGAAWVLDGVDATDPQRARVDEVIAGFVERVAPLRDAHRANREVLVAELAAPEVDRDALERIRRDEMALAETVSVELTGALGEIAEVLDAEQRRSLVERLERRHHH